MKMKLGPLISESNQWHNAYREGRVGLRRCLEWSPPGCLSSHLTGLRVQPDYLSGTRVHPEYLSGTRVNVLYLLGTRVPLLLLFEERMKQLHLWAIPAACCGPVVASQKLPAGSRLSKLIAGKEFVNFAKEAGMVRSSLELCCP